MRESRLNLTRAVADTPLRERSTAAHGGISRSLNPSYWRRHDQLGDHNARGLLDGGPDEFSGNLHDYIADSLSGQAPESPRAAHARMKLAKINARRRASQRESFIHAFSAAGYVPRVR